MKKITILLCLIGLSALSSADLVTSGLIIHLDAGSITGLSDGAGVTSWADIAPDGQDSTVYQVADFYDPQYGMNVTYGVPTYVSNAINGKAAVRFTRPANLSDPADKQILLSKDDIDAGDGGYNYLNGVTMFIVSTGGNTGSDAQRAAQFGRMGGQAGQHLAMDLNSDRSGARFSNGYFLTDAGASPFAENEWMVAMAQLGQAEAYSTMRYAVNGEMQSGSSNNTNAINYAANNNDFSLGCGRHPDANHAFAWLDWYDGDIAEVLVYNAQLTTEQIAEVNDYLMAKYSIVPEPATLLLLGLGTICTLRMRRRV